MNNDQIIILTFVFLLGVMIGIGISANINYDVIKKQINYASNTDSKILKIDDVYYTIEKYNASKNINTTEIIIKGIQYDK